MTQQVQQPDPKTPITLVLPLNAVEGVIAALMKLPYEQSAQLIEEVRNQAIRALQPPADPAPTPSVPETGGTPE